MTAADAALGYIQDSFRPVPIPHRQKNPGRNGWQHLRMTAVEVPHYFDSAPQNIGVLLGDDFGTADMDLDCPEAIAAASELAPETRMIFGRKSKRASHRFYRCDPAVRSRKYVDPLDGKKTIVELRCQKTDGSIGLQTVVPPSVHESGELIEFEPGCTRIPANIDAAVLESAVASIAAAAVLARHWPVEGSRHEGFLALAGVFARNGRTESNAIAFHRAVYRGVWGISADLDAAAVEVKSTYQKHKIEGNVTGIPRLNQLINPRVVDTVCEWLHFKVTADDWPEPILLADHPIEPLSADVLPGVLGEYSQALSRSTETPAELTTLSVPALFQLQRRQRLKWRRNLDIRSRSTFMFPQYSSQAIARPRLLLTQPPHS